MSLKDLVSKLEYALNWNGTSKILKFHKPDQPAFTYWAFEMELDTRNYFVVYNDHNNKLAHSVMSKELVHSKILDGTYKSGIPDHVVLKTVCNKLVQVKPTDHFSDYCFQSEGKQHNSTDIVSVSNDPRLPFM
ncbi:hypothetical protein [Pseudoalteromonas phage J2-1_QLiu-2017]|nr:hypothetical protein [Pseudoalteromonas phage J2-1_QLiu-2017]